MATIKLNETLTGLIAKAVQKNHIFTGKIGSGYTVQDLMHTASLRTLDEMYKTVKKQISNLSDESLFSTTNDSKKKVLEFEAELIKELFTYRSDISKAAEDLKAKKAKLTMLKELKDKKEIEALGNLSITDLEKEISEIESES